jgi:hypothetical protein
MKAYFKTFGTGQYKAWGGYGGSIKGIHIYLNNKNGVEVVVLSFPNKTLYDNLYTKYVNIFK